MRFVSSSSAKTRLALAAGVLGPALAITALGAPAMATGTSATATGSFVGHVWNDADRDARLDTKELGVAGVRLILIDNRDGTFVDETRTRADGSYTFSDVPVGPKAPAEVLYSILAGTPDSTWTWNYWDRDPAHLSDSHIQPLEPGAKIGAGWGPGTQFGYIDRMAIRPGRTATYNAALVKRTAKQADNSSAGNRDSAAPTHGGTKPGTALSPIPSASESKGTGSGHAAPAPTNSASASPTNPQEPAPAAVTPSATGKPRSGGLPVTGASVTLLAAAGGLVLAVGLGLLLVFRRRRTV